MLSLLILYYYYIYPQIAIKQQLTKTLDLKNKKSIWAIRIKTLTLNSTKINQDESPLDELFLHIKINFSSTLIHNKLFYNT